MSVKIIDGCNAVVRQGNGSEKRSVMKKLPIEISQEKLIGFCGKWKIIGIELFGSVLRDDFGPDSDIDVLATFSPDADWSLWDHVAMEDELSSILGRKADLISKRAIERSGNWIRKAEILSNAVPLDVQR
jgi:uncharacterized protein